MTRRGPGGLEVDLQRTRRGAAKTRFRRLVDPGRPAGRSRDSTVPDPPGEDSKVTRTGPGETWRELKGYWRGLGEDSEKD